jgi:DNA polymerase-3 subunit alpha
MQKMREKSLDDNFVHLHMHTEYSLLDGINQVSKIPTHISSLGQKAVAITDHGNVSGSYRFYKECKAAGVKPIIGMEAYYTVEDRKVREKDDLGESYYHLVLIAMNNVGLKNLYKLSTYAYTEGMYRKPRIDDDLIGQYSEGIIATTACLGSRISQLILKDKVKEAEYVLDHHRNLFDKRLLIELQLHDDPEQKKVNQVLLNLAKEKQMSMILTNDCHYTSESDKNFHEIALCMQTKTTLSNEKRFSFGDIDVHVAHHDWMWNKAQAIGIPYDAVSNTRQLANMVDSDDYFSDKKNRYPKYNSLKYAKNSWDELEYLCKQKLFQKMGEMPSQVYRDRIDKELSTIKKMGFSDYLLIVADFLDGAREQNVYVGPGRGSAAGSLVAYALDITKVDPIKYGLIFERFLNYGRAARPIIFNKEQVKYIKESSSHKNCTHKHKCDCSH